MTILIVILIFLPVVFFNNLVSKKNRVESAFSAVDVVLKKRYDLIPGLVAVVKGYADHEAAVLTALTALRERAVSAGMADQEKIKVDAMITPMMLGILMRAEAYPQLKADRSFLQLQTALVELEAQIAAARRVYNVMVVEYNNAVEMIPTNMMAAWMDYHRREFFAADDGRR